MMLRTFTQADLKALLVIEQSAHVSPWTDETFRLCFESGYLGWVIELDNCVIGFIIASMRVEECHLLNLCIAGEHQHKGYGRLLLEHLLQEARARGMGIAYLEVRKSNSRAISLYKRMEFRLVGTRKDYYATAGGTEDALIFARSLVDSW